MPASAAVPLAREHRAAEAVAHHRRQVPDVVDVRVGQHHRVDACRPAPGRAPSCADAGASAPGTARSRPAPGRGGCRSGTGCRSPCRRHRGTSAPGWATSAPARSLRRWYRPAAGRTGPGPRGDRHPAGPGRSVARRLGPALRAAHGRGAPRRTSGAHRRGVPDAASIARPVAAPRRPRTAASASSAGTHPLRWSCSPGRGRCWSSSASRRCTGRWAT